MGRITSGGSVAAYVCRVELMASSGPLPAARRAAFSPRKSGSVGIRRKAEMLAEANVAAF